MGRKALIWDHVLEMSRQSLKLFSSLHQKEKLIFSINQDLDFQWDEQWVYTQRALEQEREHIPSQCFVVMRPNSRKVPKEARREKNTMLTVSQQHKSACGVQMITQCVISNSCGLPKDGRK